MKMSGTTMRRGVYGAFAGCVLGGVAAATIAIPTATATPAPCTASGLAGTLSSVSGAAAAYLDSHPGTNDALSAAGSQPAPQAESAVRGYFQAHPQEYFDLRGIVAPLSDLSNRCGVSVSPGQAVQLFQAFQAG